MTHRRPEDLDARARREAVIAQTSSLRPTRTHIERTYGGEWEAGPISEPLPRKSEAEL